MKMRILSMLLVFFMLFGMMPMAAFATESEEHPWRGRSAVFALSASGAEL